MRDIVGMTLDQIEEKRKLASTGTRRKKDAVKDIKDRKRKAQRKKF